ncbi:MAG: hypothetical protein KKB95_09750 [Gammaproteobacteria bacterium]|jgi:hypothetical protein|nr:hypothetical protein [Gammaproteobacteria bacterium]MBU0828772.1 hypothetical protein [Gammaproteobacteria bacterium]MBU0890216.1 hypothetical protein [Gammaproteobacteria bacterium]MBU1352162.1 hypothetical protein [Gammaproteobacteria bacterium]MBU1505844.1 hypothetical protein [Gammaproteobacteria bacterium]
MKALLSAHHLDHTTLSELCRATALRFCAVSVAMLVCLSQVAWSYENPETMQATPMGAVRKGATADPTGLWQGRWEVTRDHPQIRTRAGALALQLDIQHGQSSASPRVRWMADRALCESPVAAPCEWVGSRGVASAVRVVNGHLLMVLQVSADDSDPMVVWLERPQEGRSARGTLISARGDLAYTLEAQRP